MEFLQEQVKPYGNDSKCEEVEVMFNHIASTYDRLNHILSLGIDHRWRQCAVDALRPFHPKRMLDVAIGTADLAILACKELQPESLVGIDISEEMMRIGGEKVAKAQLSEKISFVREDCTTLSFADSSFDAVTVAFGIRNFEKLDKGLAEMYRVLSLGGHLVILELSIPNRFPMRQLFTLYASVVMPLIGKIFSKDNSAYTYLPRSIRAFPQGEVMQKVIQQAGFSKVDFERLTFGTCTLYTAVK